MTRALIVIFHRYPGMTLGFDRILGEYFKKQLDLWGNEVNKIYLVNSNNYLENITHNNIERLNTNNLSHAQNLNAIFPLVKEDYIAIIDMDTIIYQKGRLGGYFGLLEAYDVCSFIEKHGEHIDRFCPYFFVGKRSIFPENPDFSENPPEYLDPFSKLTHELLKKDLKILEIKDDRSTIQLGKEGIIRSGDFRPTGTYHIRNFMGGIILLDTYLTDKKSFRIRFEPMPFEEVTRLFAWAWLINKKTLNLFNLEEVMLEILDKEMGISEEKWEEFMEEFKDYHDK